MNVQKVKFSIKDFVSKCDQIRSFQNLLKKSLMEKKNKKKLMSLLMRFCIANGRTDDRTNGQTEPNSKVTAAGVGVQ